MSDERIWTGSDSLLSLLAPIESVQTHERNPRRGDIESVRASLGAFGQQKPIVVNAEGKIVAGNHTFMAAREEGWTHIAISRSNLSELDEKRYMLADNRTSDLGTYDDDMLNALLVEIGDEHGSVEATGYTPEDVSELQRHIQELNEILPERQPPPPQFLGYRHELNSLKLGLRLQAVAHCAKRDAYVETFAGTGQLSYWYRQMFGRGVHVDAAEELEVDHHMKAERYIRERLVEDGPFDFIDLDDEGCPSAEMDALFEVLPEEWLPVVVCITDGMGLHYGRHFSCNLERDYKWASVRKSADAEVHNALPALIEHSMVMRSHERGWVADRINLEWKPGTSEPGPRNVVFGAWTIRKP